LPYRERRRGIDPELNGLSTYRPAYSLSGYFLQYAWCTVAVTNERIA
jgi:hypothetical protein